MSESTTDAVVTTEVRDSVGIITLNRPKVRNALNLELREAMQDAMERFDDDPAVLAIVLTGAGGNFCSGRDLKAATEGEPMYRSRRSQQASFNRKSIQKPVIAAIEGYALAGGFELAISCDIIVAAQDSVFGLPEVKRNLVAIGGGLIRLPSRIPYHVAMQLALTGEHVGAEQLERWGLVTTIVDPGKAVDAAYTLGMQIAENGPSAIRATKEIVRRAFEWGSEADAFDAQLPIAESALTSSDRDEGIAAFFERRAPVWTDR
ncbi:crotonase/enoyl-CoA hydratase family protein [Rhodococcus sp. ARC_M6]|uniref:crotonase/enoyl-CoA hydratase family protein n=1 Tax=Rhodococcus sp. ARC_M6 TaxID=2928852 RepID=UPI001FB4C708|nr:crotonase/enoyl-CoA hydratase family protein [Rhodococcus sp. ARC_M6]MCJ0907217.1 crotonase/enoyl-CoA hydratase family protein [Rhodococcus sp. ARC_M6]